MQEKLPYCKVAVSTTALRSDIEKATLIVNQLTNNQQQSTNQQLLT